MHRDSAARCFYFYPRPPRGGRLYYGLEIPDLKKFLSTPSARRATWDADSDSDKTGFLSTPSARRATMQETENPKRLWISIHALREEGDE